MAQDDRETVAQNFGTAAAELRAAADHLENAATHFRSGEIPRGCAHAFAAEGHVLKGNRLVEENAIIHSGKARRERPVEQE